MNAPKSVTQRVLTNQTWALFDEATSRAVEHAAQSQLPPNTLMQRAGLAIAELALAISPHSQRVWIACGPGNNGGDGLEAAIHLHAWGKQVHVSWLGSPQTCPADARMALSRLQGAGIDIQKQPPTQWDLAVDALLGLGCDRTVQGDMAHWQDVMQTSDAPVLHVDLPSGLSANTGRMHAKLYPCASRGRAARHTLALLTLKPGLFTADGRDATGTVWFNDLGVSPQQVATALLQSHAPQIAQRRHNSHKGSYGNVAVIGGAQGMSGAAVLAGLAALRGGAGRVTVSLLDTSAGALAIAPHPQLMWRDAEHIDWRQCTAVCGCGGGDDVRHSMPQILSQAPQLVLDADALNALHDASLRQLLVQRHRRDRATVLTPHPLEAARLLQCDVTQIQHDRLQAARTLADQTHAVVILKGAGSIIAAPGETPVINATGNPRLASAGSGDVLAGLVGALLAQGLGAFEAACVAVARHGQVADEWPRDLAFDALLLTQRL